MTAQTPTTSANPRRASVQNQETIALQDRPTSAGSEQETSPDQRTLASGSDTEVAVTPDPTVREAANKELSSSTTDTEQVEAVVEQKWLEGLQLFAVLGSVTLVIFLMLLDLTIISTAIPQITQDFRSLDDVGWYGSAYNLASAALQPLSGKLYTHLKTKWTFIAFLALFLLGSLICGLANTSNMLIIGRAVAGMGTSGLQNGGITIISESLPLHRRPQTIGIMLGMGQIGIVVGPLVGGAITQYSTWRWCFYLNLPAGAVAILLLLLVRIPSKPLPDGTPLFALPPLEIVSKLDILGFLIFAPSSIMFLMALEFGGVKYPWSSATVIGLFIGSGVLFLVFLAWEHREGENAMIPLGMVRRREVWTSAVVTLLTMAGLMLVPGYFLPIFFQSVGGETPLMSGVYTLPSILSNLFMAVLSGFLVGKLGYTIPWVLFSAVVSSIGGGLLTMLKPDTSRAKWVGYLIVIGIGRGASLQMPLLAVQSILPDSQIPTSMALLIFAQTFGGSLFLTIANTIFANNLVTKLQENGLPPADLAHVIAAGANGFRSVVSAEQLPAVLWAYAESIDLVFYLTIAAAVLMFFLAWGMGWNDIRQGKGKDKNLKSTTESTATVGAGAV
ncbi:MFS multidrug transporter [Naviculisporaceae sp. PSN 640]